MIETQPTPTQQTTSTNMVVYQPQSLVPDEPMGDPMGNPMNNDSTDNPPAYESIFLDDSTVGNETHATEDQPESALEEDESENESNASTLIEMDSPEIIDLTLDEVDLTADVIDMTGIPDTPPRRRRLRRVKRQEVIDLTGE